MAEGTGVASMLVVVPPLPSFEALFPDSTVYPDVPIGGPWPGGVLAESTGVASMILRVTDIAGSSDSAGVASVLVRSG